MKPKAPFLNPDQARLHYPSLVRPPLSGRLVVIGIVTFLVAVAIFALARLEFSFARLGGGLAQLATFLGLMVPPSAGGQAASFFKALGETVAIAFLGTLLASLFALPLGFMAAKGMIGGTWLRFLTRRFSDTIRGVDTLIWALIWINVVGLGPFAGVLAIMTGDIGSFIKLYSEAIEASDRKPAEGIASTGGHRLHVMRFGILPQVMPVMLSQTLYYFESNTRSATIIGIVGAGGIGLYLAEMIRTFEWDRVAFIILMVLATVAMIDFLSTRLRIRLIGSRGG